MLWLILSIAAYFILAVVFLVDKYLLTSAIPNARVYAFYIGILGIGVLILMPFTNFYVLAAGDIFLSFLSGAAFLAGIFWFFKGLKNFEASRIVPAVGGFLPIFTFLLLYLFAQERESLNFGQSFAFIMLVAGSILITLEKSTIFSLQSIKVSVIAAFLLAISFVAAKFVYLNHPFLLALIWIKLGGVIFALVFLFDREVRNSLWPKKLKISRKTAVLFFGGQAAGAFANLLQNWAVALAPLLYVAFINALQGVQYVFLLVLAVLLSWKFPQILQEELRGGAIVQKITAILFLGIGLSFLALT